jgi:hypothetical protein
MRVRYTKTALAENVRQYRIHLAERGLEATTINQIMPAAKPAFRLAAQPARPPCRLPRRRAAGAGQPAPN